jgi:hypothetical protein
MDLENYFACVCLDYGFYYEDKPENNMLGFCIKKLKQVYINGEESIY